MSARCACKETRAAREAISARGHKRGEPLGLEGERALNALTERSEFDGDITERVLCSGRCQFQFTHDVVALALGPCAKIGCPRVTLRPKPASHHVLRRGECLGQRLEDGYRAGRVGRHAVELTITCGAVQVHSQCVGTEMHNGDT